MESKHNILIDKNMNDTQLIPTNHGKPWKQTDTIELLDNIKNKLTIAEIAILHKRTEGSIRCRLRDMAYQMYLDGKSLLEICEKTGLTEDELNNKINKMVSVNKSKCKNVLVEQNTAVSQNKSLDKSVKNSIERVKINLSTYNDLLVNNVAQEKIQADIAEIKSDIKQIYHLLKQLELA